MEPEGDCGSDADCREEGVGAAIVSGGNAAPVFEAAEHVLDVMALAIQRLVVWDLDLSVAPWGDAWGDPAFDQRRTEPIAVVSAITDQFLGRWQHRQDQHGTPVVVHLSFREQQHDWPAVTVANGMQLGIQSPFGAADAAWSTPFCRKLAAVR